MLAVWYVLTERDENFHAVPMAVASAQKLQDSGSNPAFGERKERCCAPIDDWMGLGFVVTIEK
jgi:hypothetical protein